MKVGLISLPFAYANYQKKKEAYEAALAKYESLKDYAAKVVDYYQNSLFNLQQRLVPVDEQGNYAQYDNAPGLKVTTVLQVGMLVGKTKMNCRTVLVVYNTNKDKDWTIILNKGCVKVGFTMLGKKFPYIAGMTGGGKSFEWRPDPVMHNVTVEERSGYKIATIKYGGYIQFVSYGFPVEVPLISKDQMKQLRRFFYQETGKSLITSVKKGTTISGNTKYNGVEILKSEVAIERYFVVDSKQAPERTTTWMVDNHGATLKYMGEAFHPASDYFGELIVQAMHLN